MKNILFGLTTAFIISFKISGQNPQYNSLYVGPISDSGSQGRIAATGTSAELSLSNRAVTTFVNSPSLGERWVIYNQGSSIDGKLRFWTGGDKVVFTKEGRVGIGTSTPSSKLDLQVKSAESVQNLTFLDGSYKIGSIGHVSSTDGIGLSFSSFTQNNVSSAVPTLVFSSYTKDFAPNDIYDAAVSIRGYNIDGNTNLQNIPIFKVLNGHSAAYLTVNANGNVGIGTTSPTNKLDVSGQTRVGGISGTTALSNADDLIVESSSNGGISLLVPNSNDANFYLGNPDDNAAAGMRWSNTSKTYTIGTLGTGSLRLLTGNFTNDQGIIIDSNGKVGIGTSTPQSKLAVDGQIRATEVKVLADISVPDYVFEPDYDLRTLKETKEYITEHKHLPEIPSAAEIGENGIDLGDMNMRLLKKIEELTLYQIELLERLEKAEEKIQNLEESN